MNTGHLSPGQVKVCNSDVSIFQMFIIQISTVFDFSSGLEYLSRIDGLFVKQLVEVLEIVTGFETENKFHILNKNGQIVYKVTRIRISNWKIGWIANVTGFEWNLISGLKCQVLGCF